MEEEKVFEILKKVKYSVIEKFTAPLESLYAALNEKPPYLTEEEIKLLRDNIKDPFDMDELFIAYPVIIKEDKDVARLEGQKHLYEPRLFIETLIRCITEKADELAFMIYKRLVENLPEIIHISLFGNRESIYEARSNGFKH